MTIAISDAFMSCNGSYEKLGDKSVCFMQDLGKKYPDAGYGHKFKNWIESDNPTPYSSYGNGAAMRVSACAYAAKTLEKSIELSKRATEVTHNHPEGIKGAEAVTVAIFMALHGKSILEIRDYIDNCWI